MILLLLLLVVVVLLLHADADWKSEEFGTQKSPNIWNIPRNTHIQTGFVYRTILSIYVSLDSITRCVAFVALALGAKRRLFVLLYTTVTP